MGSYIYLNVGKIEIAWGKNDVFEDFSSLYLSGDVKQIPYFYAGDVIEFNEGYSRKLGEVKQRLELLGYTIPVVKKLYEEYVVYFQEDNLLEDPKISFNEYASYLASINVDILNSGNVPSKFKSLMEHVHPFTTLRLLIENPEASDVDVNWGYADIVEGGWVSKSELYLPVSESDKYLIVTAAIQNSKIE